MWKRTLFFWFERLDITVAERRAVIVLTLLAIGMHSAKPLFKPDPRYDAAFYAPLMAAFDAADSLAVDKAEDMARADGPTSVSVRKPTAALIRINTATATEFQALPGIGPVLAARIIAYREEHGPFTSIDDLTKVKGIGPKLMERIRGMVVCC
jgi:competence protein ComEA